MKKLVVSPRAEMALSAVKEDELQRVYAWFDYLRRWDEDEAVRRDSVLLDELPGVYLLQTPTELRVFFRIDGDTVTILGVTTREKILVTAGLRPASNGGSLHPEKQVH